MQTTVAELCSRDILTTTPQTPVREALPQMVQSGKSSLLVLLHGEAIGIVTERDCVSNASKITSFPDLAVTDIMSSPLLTIDENMSAFAAFRQMQQQKIRHLAVLTPNYDVCGLISLSDLLFKYAPACVPPDSTVDHLMANPVLTTSPATTVQQVLAEMARHLVSCLVVAEHGRPLGMVSERDVPRILASYPQNLQQPVTEVMTSPHPTIPPHTTALEAIELMRQRGIRRLVVAGPDREIAGLITQSRLGRVLTC